MTTKKKQSQYKVQEEQPTIVEEPFITYPPLNLDLSKRYTYADYLTWMDDVRRELIDGFIHLMSAPSTIHAQLSFNLVFEVGTFFRKRKGKCRIFYAPFDVRFPTGAYRGDDEIYNVVQPDICVICDATKIDKKGCIGAPDLIVEILSPSTAKHDKDKKFHLYEKFGVREYWMVDPKAKTVHAFLLQPTGKYDSGTVYECNQKAPVRIFDGLEVDLKGLFEDE